MIQETQVEGLPPNGRNFVQLAILSLGVSGAGFGMRGTIMSGTRPDDLRPGTELFVNDNRESSKNYLYDGIDNNDRLTLAIAVRPFSVPVERTSIFHFFKEFRITEGTKLQFRIEFFNLFNHPQFDLPNAAIGAGNARNDNQYRGHTAPDPVRIEISCSKARGRIYVS